MTHAYASMLRDAVAGIANLEDECGLLQVSAALLFHALALPFHSFAINRTHI